MSGARAGHPLSTETVRQQHVLNRTVYIADFGPPDLLTALQKNQEDFFSEVRVGTEPFGVAVAPSSEKAYVTNVNERGEGRVTSFNLDGSEGRMELAQNIPVARGPRDITIVTITPPKATVSAPASGEVYTENAAVKTAFSCEDGGNGPGIASCTDSNGARGGTGQLNTAAPGKHTYTVTATSKDGQKGTAEISYTVVKAMCASNNGTITLSPGLTEAAAVQTLKIKGRAHWMHRRELHRHDVHSDAKNKRDGRLPGAENASRTGVWWSEVQVDPENETWHLDRDARNALDRNTVGRVRGRTDDRAVLAACAVREDVDDLQEWLDVRGAGRQETGEGGEEGHVHRHDRRLRIGDSQGGLCLRDRPAVPAFALCWLSRTSWALDARERSR